MLLSRNRAISVYERKPTAYDRAPGIGILFFDIQKCAPLFDTYSQYINVRVVVILKATHPRKVAITLLKDLGDF